MFESISTILYNYNQEVIQLQVNIENISNAFKYLKLLVKIF